MLIDGGVSVEIFSSIQSFKMTKGGNHVVEEREWKLIVEKGRDRRSGM